MDTRNKGKRLASGITAAVSIGSLATAGVAAAVVYSTTPSSASKVSPVTSGSNPWGDPARDGSSAAAGGATQDGTSRSRGFSPVQPGNGSVTHGQSSGS